MKMYVVNVVKAALGASGVNVLGAFQSFYVIAESFEGAERKVLPTLEAGTYISGISLGGPYIP